MALLWQFVRVLPSPAPPFPVALKAPREEIHAALAFAAILYELFAAHLMNEFAWSSFLKMSTNCGWLSNSPSVCISLLRSRALLAHFGTSTFALGLTFPSSICCGICSVKC